MDLHSETRLIGWLVCVSLYQHDQKQSPNSARLSDRRTQNYRWRPNPTLIGGDSKNTSIYPSNQILRRVAWSLVLGPRSYNVHVVSE